MDETRVTHDEALNLIDAHIGERCYVGLHVERHDDTHPESVAMVFGKVAELKNDLSPKPPRTEPGIGCYAVGFDWFHLPELRGATIILRDNGLNFRLADNATLRVAWHGSSEVGPRAWSPTL